MSSAPAPASSPSESLTLTEWTKAHLTALYELTPTPDLDTTFSTTFSPSAEILINHSSISLNAFKEQISETRTASLASTVEFKSLSQVSSGAEGKSDQVRRTNRKSRLSHLQCVTWKAGIVAGCFLVTRSLKFRIRAASAQTYMHITFSAKYVTDLLRLMPYLTSRH